jgi:hypothetical protein
MKIKLEQIDHQDWPTFLTPELLEQLIRAKTNRVLAELQRRKQTESSHVNCQDIHCECS